MIAREMKTCSIPSIVELGKGLSSGQWYFIELYHINENPNSFLV